MMGKESEEPEGTQVWMMDILSPRKLRRIQRMNPKLYAAIIANKLIVADVEIQAAMAGVGNRRKRAQIIRAQMRLKARVKSPRQACRK